MFCARIRYVLLVALVCVGVVPVGAWAARILTIGIVPQMPAWALARRWTPVLNAWSRIVGDPIQLETAPTIAVFEQRVAAGQYDLVYLNPADYVRYRGHYRAFARSSLSLQALLVVRRGGAVQRLSELAGQTLAFPAPDALAASVEPRHFLERRHIAFTPRYVGSHDSVYRGVAQGLFPAGGGVRQTFEMLRPALRDRLQILWSGPARLPHPFAARRDLPPALVARVARALLHLPPSVQPALAALGFPHFLAATDAQYRQRVPTRP